MNMRGLVAAAALALGASLAPGFASADLAGELRGGFRYRLETLAHDTFLELEPDGADPLNLLGFPRHELGFDLRPDLDLDLRRLSLSFRPRYAVRHRVFERGFRADTSETGDDLYVQEWEARVRVTPELFVSSGRIDLQWGPSYLLSPSNPFNRNNGRDDPQVEEPGLEISRVTWIPGYRWTVTFIANTGEGRMDSSRRFSPRYALKTDFTGDGWYAAVLGSMTEAESEAVFGGYAGWTVSDALLLHAEGTTGEPGEDPAFLAGGSYTFTGGAFVVLEFFRDGSGCTDPDIADCFNPFREDPADPRDAFFRRNYLLLQFTHPTWLDRVLGTARWTRGLDDGSSRIVGILQWDATDHLRPFFTGLADLGGTRDEFGSAVRAAARVGVSLIF